MLTSLVLSAIWFAAPVSASRFEVHQIEDDVAIEGSVDWSSLVKPAGFQGGVCNSCYIWAALGSIEARLSIASGKPLQALSVQQALDCVRAEHMKEIGFGSMVYRTARGCQTGFPKPILQYAIDEGFSTVNDYPLAYDPEADGSFARDKDEDTRSCLVDTGKISANPKNAKVKSIIRKRALPDLEAGVQWVQKVKAALVTGPVAAGIDKNSYNIGNQGDVRKGKVATKDCPSHNTDHAVLLVGFGEDGGTPYWIIQNSWSEAWGHGGFFKVPLGVNFCGVEKMATYLDIPVG